MVALGQNTDNLAQYPVPIGSQQQMLKNISM